MSALVGFLRKTPLSLLADYFVWSGIVLDPPVDWSEPEKVVRQEVRDLTASLDETSADRLRSHAERVAHMADEAGQTAMLDVVGSDRATLETIVSGFGRALWLFMQSEERFRRAEDVRNTDERRRGRTWSGFEGPKRQMPNWDAAAKDRFNVALRQIYPNGKMHVDIFDRRRESYEGDDFDLVQIMVYREGLPNDELAFVGDELTHRQHFPVLEVALTYEPVTGVIEIVTANREVRRTLAQAFVNDMLGGSFEDTQVALRSYDLEPLLRSHDFATDAVDGIAEVELRLLRLMPIDSQAERVVLECQGRAKANLWAMADRRFGASNPLKGGWIVTQARLIVRFRPALGYLRGKSLTVTISIPHSCDLRDQTEAERLIGEKYLRRWGILEDHVEIIGD